MPKMIYDFAEERPAFLKKRSKKLLIVKWDARTGH
jgi:hypothetical protein